MTIPTTAVPELDIADLSAAFERRVNEACPEHGAIARRLLERLPPARWTLEWHLPWWLGRAVGLDPQIARELVLSNVLGLGSIRLQDDLADGEMAPADVAGAVALAAALYEAALQPYRDWFEPASPFWARLEAIMAEWRAATEGHAQAAGHLAAAAAPLRISAYAVCLLGGRQDLLRALDRCLDLALEGLVRYDHIADWETDLAAGRWNALVAAVSPGPQLPDRRGQHRRVVLVALMTSNAIADLCAPIERLLLDAVSIADDLAVPVPELSGFLRRTADDVRSRGTAWGTYYRDLGDRAGRLLVREPIGAR